MQFGRFRIDRERCVLEHDGEPLALAPKSVELLAVLAERAGEVVAKRELLERLWPDAAVEEANLSQHAYLIRKALRERDSALPEVLVTVPKRGYRFIPPRTIPAPTAVATPALPGTTSARSPQAPGPAVRRTPPAAPTQRPLAAAQITERFGPFAYRCLMLAAATAAVLVLAPVTGGRVHLAAGIARKAPALSAAGAEALRFGRYELDLRTRSGIMRSRASFQRVIASDPQNASGYAGLADADAIGAEYGVGPQPGRAAYADAQALARRAEALDPESADAHASLGLLAQYAHDATGAERQLRRAIVLDPTYAPAHHWLGVLLFDRARFAESLRELTVATRLNPIATATNAWLESADYMTHHYDAAIEHGNRAIELDPARPGTFVILGLAYAAKHQYSAALRTFARIAKTDGDAPSVPYLIAAVYAQSGRPDLARRLIAPLRPGAVDMELPFALLALGDERAAAAAATRLRFHDCRERRLFAADPRLDTVRGNAAFGPVLNGRCAAID